MGASYMAAMVVGVNLAGLVICKNMLETVTKYDPDTGEPVLKKVTKTRWELCGKDVSLQMEMHPGKWRSLFPGLDMLGTGAERNPSGIYDLTLFVVGVPLAQYTFDSWDGDGPVVAVAPEEMALAFGRAVEALTRIGYTGSVSLQLVCCSSC